MSSLAELTLLVDEVGMSFLAKLILAIYNDYLVCLFSSVWREWDVFTENVDFIS